MKKLFAELFRKLPFCWTYWYYADVYKNEICIGDESRTCFYIVLFGRKFELFTVKGSI